ncbi:restriction endonuclease subunit S [Pseudomonas sp. GD03909]|nr:restriction endonuclease subunit S [Pseudomonas sp. GD03909]
MTALLTDNLPLLAGAPNGIKKLRELILELAVRGKLVPQNPNDEPASELLKRIAAEKKGLSPKVKKSSDTPMGAVAFELPESWCWASFGDIAQHNSGKTLDKGKNSGVPRNYITTSNLYWGRFDLASVRQMLFEEKHLARCTAIKNDLLICEGGEAGRAAVWDQESEICFQNHVHRARFFGEINPYYAQRYFERLNYSGEIAEYRKGVGISNMSSKALASIPMPVPPLAEQHRIVAKVDELMALCDRLEAQQADAESAHAQLVQALLGSLTQAADAKDFAANWQRLAEHFHTLFTTESSIDALKQTVLQLAVMGKLVPQDPSDEHASELLKRIAEEKVRLVAEGKLKKQKILSGIGEEERAFELPQGWQWVRKAEVFSFLNGYAFKSEWFRPEGIRLLRNVNVSHGVINWKETACISEEQAAEFQGFALDENDVVLTLDRPIISTGLKYAVIRSADLPCLLLQRVAKIAPYAGAVTVSYLSAWLNSRFFIDSIDPGRSNGVPHISTNQVASMPFALPPLAEQHRIVAKVDHLMALCDQLKTRLTQARQLNEQLATALVEQAVA